MFARWAMAQAGIDIGLTTVQQWPANGLLPDTDNAASTPLVERGVGPDPPPGGYRPADLIFFGHGAGDAGHVALWLGNGLIVQCSGERQRREHPAARRLRDTDRMGSLARDSGLSRLRSRCRG